MDAAPPTWLVINRASGSNDDAAVDALVAALKGAGHPPRRVVALPEEELPGPRDLAAAGVGRLAVFTGDGTVNAVVTGLSGWPGEVVVLPGGTQNLLARACHGESTAEEIVGRLGRGELEPAERPAIRSSRGDALCEIVAGPGATWSDVREALREVDLPGVASTVREAIAQSASGPMVAVVEPALGKPEGYSAIRVHPQGMAMAIDGYGAAGLAGFARQGLALVRRDFREGPHDHLGTSHAVLCRSDAPIALMIDGERSTGSREERFTLVACDVTFLVTPEPAKEG